MAAVARCVVAADTREMEARARLLSDYRHRHVASFRRWRISACRLRTGSGMTFGGHTLGSTRSCSGVFSPRSGGGAACTTVNVDEDGRHRYPEIGYWRFSVHHFLRHCPRRRAILGREPGGVRPWNARTCRAMTVERVLVCIRHGKWNRGRESPEVGGLSRLPCTAVTRRGGYRRDACPPHLALRTSRTSAGRERRRTAAVSRRRRPRAWPSP